MTLTAREAKREKKGEDRSESQVRMSFWVMHVLLSTSSDGFLSAADYCIRCATAQAWSSPFWCRCMNPSKLLSEFGIVGAPVRPKSPIDQPDGNVPAH